MMTAHHIHNLPGRLRIRVPELKRNPERAADTEGLLKPLLGILSVQANPLTGSVLVHYNTQVTGAAAILNAAGVNSAAPDRRFDSELAVLQDNIARAMLWYIVEKVVERSVPLLLAAIF